MCKSLKTIYKKEHLKVINLLKKISFEEYLKSSKLNDFGDLIYEIYAKALKSGALGEKILRAAGGGGFFILR
jgi:galactokinase/mevalonate kinase-like predicted kinase